MKTINYCDKKNIFHIAADKEATLMILTRCQKRLPHSLMTSYLMLRFRALAAFTYCHFFTLFIMDSFRAAHGWGV